MLAYCRQCALPIDSYLAFDHPLQKAIRSAVAHLTGVAEGALVAGIDGCSAPNYAVPLDRLAFAYARLAAAGDDERYGAAPAKLAAAMTAHPDMVSGERRNDLTLMRAGRGDWVTKVGAEGVQAIGVAAAHARDRGGSPSRSSTATRAGCTRRQSRCSISSGFSTKRSATSLPAWREPPIRNYRGIGDGTYRPCRAA